jgi:hypothetical protein
LFGKISIICTYKLSLEPIRSPREAITIFNRQFVVAWAAYLLALGPQPANPISLGVVIHADRAHVGEAVASEGSTIYEGDRLSTDSGGLMRIDSPALRLQLDAQSTVTLRRAATPQADIMAELASGTLVFSAARDSNVLIVADDAMIRPIPNAPVVAHVRVVNLRELRIYAQRGALEFSYHGDSQTIPEGAAYRVLLDPDAQPSVTSEPDQLGKSAPKHHPTFVLLGIGAALGVAIPVLMHAFESPDSPGHAPTTVSHKP